MKKILLALIVILLFLLALPADFASALPLIASGETDCYIYSRTSDAQSSSFEGFCAVTGVKLAGLAETLPLCDGVMGVSAKPDGNADAVVDGLCRSLQLRIVRIERIEGGLTVFYAFSPMIAQFVRLFGTRVNVQIAVSDGVVRVGSPLLLGGY